MKVIGFALNSQRASNFPSYVSLCEGEQSHSEKENNNNFLKLWITKEELIMVRAAFYFCLVPVTEQSSPFTSKCFERGRDKRKIKGLKKDGPV